MPYKALTDTAAVWPTEARESVSTPLELVTARRVSVLFVAQPQTHRIGGIQRHSRRLYEALRPHFDVARWPDLKSPMAVRRFLGDTGGLRYMSPGRPIIYCDSAVSIIIATSLMRNTERVLVGTVHGLDTTIPLKPYQWTVRRALRRLDKVVCVSRATAAEVASHGVPEERITVIHNASEPRVARVCSKLEARQRLEEMIGARLRDKKVLLSIGRPVKRKGFDSFAGTVFPYLREDCVYIVAGPELEPPAWLRYGGALLTRRARRNLLVATGFHSSHARLVRQSANPRMYYLNGVSDNVRDLLYAACDLFVLPNRRIPGDMEGFGIVALEAAARGIPVVAFAVEGVTDAVIDGRNGVSVVARDYRGMRDAIEGLLADQKELERFGQKAAQFTHAMYSLQKVTGQYVSLFNDLAFSR